MIKRVLNFVFAVFMCNNCFADEGMWIPMLLEKYNIETMNEKGFKLTAEDIYSINQVSLKDAVIGLGREGHPFAHFCTGELVSNQGLMFTNHHCAFGMIQAHSSLEKNYLKDGFWAQNLKEELANPGTTASILVRMEDVTPQLQEILNADIDEETRNAKLKSAIRIIEEKAVENTNLSANVKAYFSGNQYILSVYKIYKDVRLVGAPPSAIGRFGGDTDNWVWPRHTGDFSVLRIYADKNNEPASYSPDNIPYMPKKYFRVSTQGNNEGDFTMVFGYPGTTNQYATSFEIAQTINHEYPSKIAIRTAKLNILNRAMDSDELIRIKYAAKAANIANAWKKWQGEVQGVARFATIAKKQEIEARFNAWSQDKPTYASLLKRYQELFAQREELIIPLAYIIEAGLKGAEAVTFAGSLAEMSDTDAFTITNLQNLADSFYKDYDLTVDKAILTVLLELYKEQVDLQWQPKEIAQLKKQDIKDYVNKVYGQSICSTSESLNDFLKKFNDKSSKHLSNDPLVKLYRTFQTLYKEHIYVRYDSINRQLKSLEKSWMAGLVEMEKNKILFPNANSTLRVSYGAIEGYKPKDGVKYKYYTTLAGIMEKDIPTIYDYNVPQRLRDLYHIKDFGNYTQEGAVPVCFIASNHTTGGNSGSPVLNANGDLIGINFDRAWDGVMSDMDFQPTICRNIAVDIRYVLFIMDKLAEAKHLVDEMEIVY